MLHPSVAWSLVSSTSMCSLYNMQMWKLPEIIASYYITVAVSDVFSDAQGNRNSGNSNCCSTFCRPLTIDRH